MTSKKYLKSLIWLDDSLTAITNPGALWLTVNEPKPRFRYYTLVFTPAVSASLIIAMSSMSTQSVFFYSKISYGWIGGTLFMLMTLFLHTLTVDGILQIFSHGGHFRQLLQISLFAQLPLLLVLPGMMVVTTIGFAPVFFFIVLLLAGIIWNAFIETLAISQCSGRSFEQALLIWAGSWLVWLTAGLLITVAISLLFFSAL